MKRSIFAKAFAAACLVILASCGGNNTLTVMSYNIRNAKANDGDNSWEIRKDATTEMVKTLKPDVFGVQEAYPEQVSFITDQCPDYVSYGLGRDDGIAKGEHMSIFYNKKILKMEDHGTWWLSETPDSVSFGWDARCRRTATWARLADKRNGKKFYFVNTHLDHKGVQARINGLALIVDKIAGMNPEGYPMVLMGDFNVTPEDSCLFGLNKVMLSARETAVVSDDKPSFQGFGLFDPTIIDYIYYSGFPACDSFRVVDETFAGKPYISDHYPIISTLEY